MNEWKARPDNKEDFYFCICGHTKFNHYLKQNGCNECFFENKSQDKWQHTFQLDNLSYIEQLSKERGLV